MKIRGVELLDFVDQFNALMANADYQQNYQPEWTANVMGRTFSFRFRRSFDGSDNVITRRVECSEWSMHTEILDATYEDARVIRVIFSGDDQRFMSDMIAFKLAN